MSLRKFIFHSKNVQSFTLCFVVICIVVNDGFCQAGLQANEKVIAHLTTFRATYTASMTEKKPELMQEYYSEEVRLMPEFQKTVIGKGNALAYHKAFTDRFDVQQFRRKEKEILDLGLIVTELGTFTMKIRSKATNKDYDVQGKYFDIWQESENRLPVLVTEAWNYNYPLEIEDQFRFNEIPAVDVAFQLHVPVNSNISFELAALNSLMEATVSQHDAKIWSQFYTDDCMVLYSRNPIYEDKATLNGFLEAHTKELPVFEKLDIRNDRIDNLGNYVIEYASHIANWRSGEYSGVNTGKDVRIWRREKDGSLKIYRHIGMYD